MTATQPKPTTPNTERRFSAALINARARVEIRGDGDEPQHIFGYAAVYYREGDPGSEYWIWDDLVERILPGAFDRAISEKHDARGLFNHDPDNLLGRVSAGTLELASDSVGLSYNIPIDLDDPDHQRVVAKIRRGDLTGSSFAFSNPMQNWIDTKNADGDVITVREITDLDLHDVSPCTNPAYESTAAGIRAAVVSELDLIEARSRCAAHRSAIDIRRADLARLDRLRIDRVKIYAAEND